MSPLQLRAASRRLGLVALLIWGVGTAATGALWSSWSDPVRPAPVERSVSHDGNPEDPSLGAGVPVALANALHEAESVEPEDDFERHFARFGSLAGRLGRRQGQDTGRHHRDRHTTEALLARGPPRV